MRKLFTRFFSLMFLLVTCCFTNIGYAINECDLTIAAASVELVTDVDEICDGDYLDYKVVGYSPEDYSFAFNYNPSNPTGQFGADPEFTTPESSTFTVTVKEIETGCISNTITITAPDVLPLVTTDPGIQNALCHGGQGEITINWTGGAGNLEYYVVPDANFSLPIANLASYKKSTWQVGVPADTYYVAVQNANGCADLNVASTWKMVEIKEPAAMVIPEPTEPIVNNTCFGGTDGEYNVNNAIEGGTGPYKASIDGINWINLQAVDYEFTGLAAGDYTVTVKDVNGCTATRDFTITEPDEITFNIAIVDVACNGENNGQIIVSNIKGGLAPYTLKLAGGTVAVADQTVLAANGSATFIKLQPTYYSLTVTDDNGCTVVYENPNNSQNVIAVQSPADITFVPTPTDPDCMGEKGEISVVAKVGGVVSSAVEHSFDNGATWVTASTKEVDPGTYQVWVRNADGLCPVGPIAVTVNAKTAVTATFTNIKSPTCPGGNDGRFVINATGGNDDYTYSVDGSDFYSNSIIFETEGDHTVVIKDAKGCLSQEYVVNIPAIAINEIVLAGQTNITCFGKNTGRIDVNVKTWAYGRTPKVWYSKNKADVYTKGAVLTDATALTVGTYYVGATDAFGCFFDVAKDGTPDVIEVKITEADKLEITAALVTEQATCFGDPDGIIEITAFGGTAFDADTYAKYWLSTSNIDVSLVDANDFSDFESYDPATGISTTTVQALKGTYYVYVKDNNCTTTKWSVPLEVKGFDAVNITDPAAAALTHNKCYGEKLGAIVVAPATGGSGSLVYTLQKLNGAVWSNVVGYVDVASSSFSTLAAGTYKVVVEDMEGCEGDETGNIVITEPVAPVTFTLTPTDITCNGANNGIVQIAVAGGTPGTGGKYWFKIADQAWQEMTSPKNVVITAKGTYSIQVKDSKGCEAAAKEVTINEPAIIALTLTKTNVTTACIDVPDGKINVEVDGGVEAGEYQVSIDNETWVATVDAKHTFSLLAAGTYTIYAKDDNGCVNSDDITITQPVAISFTASVTANVKCYGSDEGVISITGITGGTAPYNVTVGTTTKVAVNGAASFSGLKAGTYTAVVTDSKGCKFMKNGLVVTEPTQLVLNATKLNDIGCTVTGKFEINVTEGTGTAPYVYYWAKSDPASGHVLLADMPAAGTKWSESNLAEVTEAGTYIIWAKDANGCIIGGEGSGTPVNEWRVKVTKPVTDIVITATVTGNPLCNGEESATITVSATGGMPVVAPAVKDYTITIDGVEVEGGVKTGLGAGKYTVVVTDEYGCTATKEVEIVEPATLTATLSKADGSFTCPESVQGYIEVKVEGGTGVYTYELWRDGAIFVNYQADNSFLVQINHVYQVKVKDANGCITTTNLIVIDEVDPVVATISETTCYDDDFASVVVSATGEEGRTFLVRYKLNNGVFTAWKPFASEYAIEDLVFANAIVAENFYSFEVKDDKGCTAATIVKSFVPTQHPLQVAAVQSDDQLSAILTISGGISPYTYVVGDETVKLPVAGDTFQVIKLQAPTTEVKVFDAHGCSVTKTLTVAPISVVAETEEEDNLANEFEVELTFSRPVTIAAGDIVGGTYTPGTGTTFIVALEGEDLATVKLELKNTIVDASGNKFAGKIFEYVIGDNTAPALASKTPTMDVTLTDNHPLFKMTFNEDVKLGEGGKLKVYKVGTTTSPFEIPVTAAMIIGKEVTVTYTTGGLDKNTEYYATVDGSALTDIAGNKYAGISDPATWTFKTGNAFATANEGIAKAASFKIYPNPFTEYVDVLNASELSKIVVTNIAGQVVKEVVNPTQRIQLNELRAGAYFISLYDEDGAIITTTKIIKR